MPNAERPDTPGQPDHARERRDEFLRARMPQTPAVDPADAKKKPAQSDADEATPPGDDENAVDGP